MSVAGPMDGVALADDMAGKIAEGWSHPVRLRVVRDDDGVLRLHVQLIGCELPSYCYGLSPVLRDTDG